MAKRATGEGRKARVEAMRVQQERQQLQELTTRYGPLDVLGMIGKERDFRALLPHSRRRAIAAWGRIHMPTADCC